jgi:hypothetical protein
VYLKSRIVMLSFLMARVRVTYVVALPAWPFLCSLPNRDSLRFELSFALDLMDLGFTLPRSANFAFGMLRLQACKPMRGRSTRRGSGGGQHAGRDTHLNRVRVQHSAGPGAALC